MGLYNAADAAANDAATYAIDRTVLRTTGEVVLDQNVAQAVDLSLRANEVELAVEPVIEVSATVSRSSSSWCNTCRL